MVDPCLPLSIPVIQIHMVCILYLQVAILKISEIKWVAGEKKAPLLNLPICFALLFSQLYIFIYLHRLATFTPNFCFSYSMNVKLLQKSLIKTDKRKNTFLTREEKEQTEKITQ